MSHTGLQDAVGFDALQDLNVGAWTLLDPIVEEHLAAAMKIDDMPGSPAPKIVDLAIGFIVLFCFRTCISRLLMD